MKNNNWTTLWSNMGYHPLTDLRREMDRIYEDLPNKAQAEDHFAPVCEVQEDGDHYLLSVEMPGIPKNDVKIEIMGSEMTISGERRNEREGKQDGGWYSERRFGKFKRTFTLPAGVSEDKIEAHYQDGVLKLTVPKAETAKPRQIKIADGSPPGFFGRLAS